MNLRLTSSALALAAMTMPALADVTPEQVWQSWVDYYQSMGYSVTEGKRDKAGETLTLSDVTIVTGTEDNQVSISIPQVALNTAGDGSVRTVFADQMTGLANGTDVDGKAYELPFAIALPGNEITTSGAPEDMTHAFDYPVMDFTLTTITNDGKERPLPIKVGVADSTGTVHVVAGAPAKYDYAMKSGKISFSGDVDGEDGENVKFDGNLTDAEITGDMAIPQGAKIEEDMNAALKAGLALSGVLKSGALTGTFEFSGTDEEGQPSSGTGKYDGKGFDLSYALSQDGLGYQVSTDAASFELSASDMPFPISYAVESGGFDMQLPVMKSDQPQPFKFAYSLAGLTLGDAIWNLFDAGAQLPRDPASVDLDVTGNMKVVKDIFDPATMQPAGDETKAPADATDDATAEGVDPDAPADEAEAMAEMGAEADAIEDASPFEPVDMTINQFALSMLGAKLHAEGALKAPASGDMTAPVGEINATYEGLNGLIDKLGTMGLIPEDQIMGVRMMLAMFAKPVAEGTDKLETRLEFKEDGSIFANGQQIK